MFYTKALHVSIVVATVKMNKLCLTEKEKRKKNPQKFTELATEMGSKNFYLTIKFSLLAIHSGVECLSIAFK